MQPQIIGLDLFSGAGGMSLGAAFANISIPYAVEMNVSAAATYLKNHKSTKLINEDIRKIKKFPAFPKKCKSIVFGDPPCQGFSTSNQRTRNSANPNNWLFKEFLRAVKQTNPDWVVFENVKGLQETNHGQFLQKILQGFSNLGYTSEHFVLCSSDFGVPQTRARLFIIANRHNVKITIPVPKAKPLITVMEALSDLPTLSNGANEDYLPYPNKTTSKYAQKMRGNLKGCTNHLISRNSDEVLKRYKHVPQGGNWESIPKSLMRSYTDVTHCHTGIYRRLDGNKPAVVIGNFRKNMLIHPIHDRGLSVREAARLQSFPDWYHFEGSIGLKQQQVGNAVPPLLAEAVFKCVVANYS